MGLQFADRRETGLAIMQVEQRFYLIDGPIRLSRVWPAQRDARDAAHARLMVQIQRAKLFQPGFGNRHHGGKAIPAPEGRAIAGSRNY